MNWLLALPCWGASYIDRFTRSVLPPLAAALDQIEGNVRILVHTDDPKRMSATLAGLGVPIETMPPPRDGGKYAMFGHAHRDAIALAKTGEGIAFLTADIIVSRECFAASERQFLNGKRLIISAAPSVVEGLGVCPRESSSAELLEWALQYRHPIIAECRWGVGRSKVAANIYFETETNCVIRGFHLHPFAAIKSDSLRFNQSTVDLDLAESFSIDEIHVVVDKDEMALVEISPSNRAAFTADGLLDLQQAVRWARSCASARHLWFFGHRIVIKGDGRDVGDGPVCDAILRDLAPCAAA